MMYKYSFLENKRSLWPLVVLLSVSILFIVFIILLIRKNQKTDAVVNSESAPSQVQAREVETSTPLFVPRLFDGKLVEPGKELLRPVAVMIDNYIDARPTSGISRAELVIEAPVEAGITRFLAFYADEEDVTVGPVRSARPYFVDWAQEYQSIYAHVGGSPAGLETIKSSRVVDADDVYGREYFWRDKKRYAPHNMYASTKSLRIFGNTQNAEPSQYGSWKYHPVDYEPVYDVVGVAEPFIEFRPGTNEVSWKYDPEKNEYVRYEGREKYTESDGAEILTKNVVLVHMEMNILDNVGRRAFETTGEGKADIFYDGVHFENIIWKKTSLTDRIQFFQEGSEEPFPLRVGTTWIEVVPTWGVDWGVKNRTSS